MLKMLMNGLILLTMFSCSTYIVKEPQPVYIFNHKFGVVAKGMKNFNVRNGVDEMGGWIEKPVAIEWSEVPENIIGFPLEIWLTKIRPAIKSLARKHRDDRD